MRLGATDIVKRYKRRTVVQGVSVHVDQGEIVGLLGPNGAGKTTSFYMIVGLIKPNSGKVYLDNEDITQMAMYKRAQRGIGYLPQEASVFRKLSVEDNISAILEMSGKPKEEQRHKLESLISEFNLHKVRKSNGDTLSGGERRRTEIARALATDPKFILLDEPFAGVDPIAVEDIQSIVSKLKEKNIGVLITDHNVQETLSITDRAYLLIEGKIFREGTAEELASDPQVRQRYLGRNFELRAGSFSDGVQQFLASLSPVELAYLVEFKVPNLSKESQEKVDKYLGSVFMPREVLREIFAQASSSAGQRAPGGCPRCGSMKLSFVDEPKMIISKYEALGAQFGSTAPMVTRVSCMVCDLIISDPNNGLDRGALLETVLS